jgi:protein-S-isoprenylcysteine O-methyltransferase Ste14
LTTNSGEPAIRARHLLPYALIFVGAPLLTYVVGKLVDGAFALPSFPPLPWNLVFGFSVFVPALFTGIRATRTLLKIGKGLPWGELNAGSRTRYLVTMGPYRYSRNPMALGYSLLPCGMGIMFQSIGMAVFIPLVALTASLIWTKAREEPNLERRFGESFREYRSKTPFLMPSIGLMVDDAINRLGFTRGVVIAYTLLPVASLTVLAALAFIAPRGPGIAQAEIWAVGSSFLSVCAWGAIASVRPSLCLSLIVNRIDGARGAADPSAHPRAGHHPPSAEFSSHVFPLRGRVLCAGCTGLFIGAVVSAIGSLLFFFWGLGGWVGGSTAFWLGFAGMALPILRYPFYRPKHATIRILLGFSFVVGGLLLLTAVCNMSGSFLLAIFTLAVIIYMIYSRIVLSQAEHKTTMPHG